MEMLQNVVLFVGSDVNFRSIVDVSGDLGVV